MSHQLYPSSYSHTCPEFDEDPDDLDDHALATLSASAPSPRLNRQNSQTMPLLVGLVDSASIRRSQDGTLSTSLDHDLPNGVDLESLAAQRTAGGSLLDSIANMANSILGAGQVRPFMRVR